MTYAGMVAPRPLEKSAVFPCRWARYLRVYFRGGFAPASLKHGPIENSHYSVQVGFTS